jgi:hypothetical protein
VLLPLYMIDCLMNAMINPVFVLAIGGLAGAGMKAKVVLAANRAPTHDGRQPLGTPAVSVVAR